MADVLDVSRVSPGPGAPAGWTPRPWDSTFFGLSIAQITPDWQTATELTEAVRTAAEASIDCLYLLADANDSETVRAADANGFARIDIRLTLECAVGAAAAPESSASATTTQQMPPQEGCQPIRSARLEDLPQLTTLARVSHRNTRFYQDTRFDRARSDDLYALWIERSVRGELADAVWVVDVDGAPRGYLTLSAGEEAASIGLVAVDTAYRGRGYGEQLLRTAGRWASDRCLSRMSVVTQGGSAAAVRFYERAGFTSSRVQLWYHKWLH